MNASFFSKYVLGRVASILLQRYELYLILMILISKHYRSQYLSEKNIGMENYKIIVEHLKNY